MVLVPLDRTRRANLNIIDEKVDYTLKCTLACRLSLLEQWPQLRLACLLCGCEVLIQAKLDPRQALAPSQHDLTILAHCKLKQHHPGARAYRRGAGPRSHRSQARTAPDPCLVR
jgi:hypothetical protein